MSERKNAKKASEYMRQRRPEHFSDSIIVENKKLPKSHFEYILETLTSRRQETQFEHFCRKLCEKEIAPNLIPQTGPTGGGDSKVDTETYPVTNDIAQTWYINDSNKPSNERWAFAFSAKKAWKDKVRSDIEGIASTNRDYKLIYFISNQFIKDKDRAKFEDELSTKYNIPVRILGREWIVEKIYNNDYLDIAISTLNIEGYSEDLSKKIGPNDYRKIKKLEDLESNIKDCARYQGIECQLVEDCLEAAKIIRSLEKPKEEIHRAFQRAKQIAEKHNLPYHLFKVNYHLAWTNFFWFDNTEGTISLYPELENFCNTTDQIEDIQNLANLFNLLYSDFKKGLLLESELNLDKKKDFILKKLEVFINNSSRPASALWAKTIKLNFDMLSTTPSGDLTSVIKEYNKILNESEGLLDYPLESTINLLKEIEPIFQGHEHYNDLFDNILDKIRKRESDLAAGHFVYNRAINSIKAEEHNEAIKLFGKAMIFFSKEESQKELIYSLYGIAKSYEKQGLLWAARSNYIAATERSLSIFWKEGKLTSNIHNIIKKIIWIEIKIGRPVHVMHWMELLNVIIYNQQLSKEDQSLFDEDRNLQDVINGLLILKTDLNAIEELQSFPDIYEILDMPLSKLASLYILKQFDEIHKDKYFGDVIKTEQELDIEFKQWIKQPASQQIASTPNYESSDNLVLKSNLLSVKIEILFLNSADSRTLAEIILGSLESLWATSIGMGVLPHRSSFKIYLSQTNLKKEEFLKCKNEIRNGETVLAIEYSLTQLHDYSLIEERQLIKDKLLEVAAMVLSNIAYIDDIEKHLTKIFKDESAHSRSLSFAELHISLKSIFGENHSFNVGHWSDKVKSLNKYEILRTEDWYRPEIQEAEYVERELRPGNGPPPEELLNTKNLKHGEQYINSLIDGNLWDKAKWKATAYLFHPQFPPHIFIGYENYEFGKQIFIGLRNKLGSKDTKGELRVSIIKGIDRKNPYAYSVLIGANPLFNSGNNKIMILLSRINRMDATSSINLDNFVNLYNRMKVCYLAPSSISNIGSSPNEIQQYSIQLSEVIIRHAWEIGENDIDISGIPTDCEPVIPEGITDAPVIKAMKQSERFSKK